MLGKKIEILRKFFIEGKGKKQIAKELKLSKNTVKTYIADFLENKKELIESGVSKFELIENMLDTPKYRCGNRPAVVMTNDVKATLDKFLLQNQEKRQNGNIKLIMTAKDMHEELIEQGFSLSYPSVAVYVRKAKSELTSKEAFIKQTYNFGEVCEFDWGDVKLVINGVSIKIKMAVFTLAKSNFRFAYLYRNENTESFIDAHIRFFRHIGGVPKCMVYDNMKVAVAKFIGKTEKEATIALKQISLYYGFNYRFCNIRAGNEKGHVENSVDFVRRKAFSSNNNFQNLEEALERLGKRLEKYNGIKTNFLKGLSPYELLCSEKEYLNPLPPDYINCFSTTGRVDKLSTISYMQNRYSVPDFLVSKIVDIRVFIDKVEIFYQNSLVATHKRLHGNKEWSIDIMHFIKTLSRKPGALVGSVAFSQIDNTLKEIYTEHFSDNSKDFIELLNIVGTFGIESVTNTIHTLSSNKISITSDSIKLILSREKESFECSNLRTTSPQQEQIELFSRQHLKRYDLITGTNNIEEVVAV